MKKTILYFAASISLALIALTATAAENDWLIGKWELSYDSANGPKDWLEFAPDGRTFGITPEGRRIPGRYTLKNSEIEVLYSYDGKMIPLTLKYNDTKDKLFAYSSKTKNSSQYKKVVESK